MRDPHEAGGDAPREPDWDDDLETAPTSRADLESAGRSCMAIVVLATAILILLVIWIAYSALGVGL